ncbi:MAG: phosphopentomutase [Clostridia bacterium]
MNRIFLIVLDGCGIGALPDASKYSDVGSNTLRSVSSSSKFYTPNLAKLGLFHIDGSEACSKNTWLNTTDSYRGVVCRMAEMSCGKDSTVGHWELAGHITTKPFPTFEPGFPDALLSEFKRQTGRGILSNEHISGTEVIQKYGREHQQSGKLIVYTAADSVFQIAAHEEIVPLEELYASCRIARALCVGEYLVGRVIARPFLGEWPNYVRTSNRHDFTIPAPKDTMLDCLMQHGIETIGVGKIHDIFSGRGLHRSIPTCNNADGIEKTIELSKESFHGLCFTNLVDFDMNYGHRRNVDGFAEALSYFDTKLPQLLAGLQDDDLLILTADHGCDPKMPGSDHCREYVPVIVYGKHARSNINLGTRQTFADLGATVLSYFGIQDRLDGTAFLKQIIND